MSKIKVAQVITRLDWGGAPDIVRLICTHLNPEVYDITLITGFNQHLSFKTQEFISHFADKIIVIPQLKRDVSVANDIFALARLFIFFKREKFDIVHTHTAKAGTLGRIAAFICGVPVIIHTPHGHNFYGYFNSFLSNPIILVERLLAFLTDKIIALTRMEKKDYLKFRVAKDNKICVIYQGIEIDRAAQLSSPKGKIKIKNDLNILPGDRVAGMIARLEPVKGPQYFIDAAKKLLEIFSNLRFIVVGEGSLRKKLEEKVECLNVRNKFIFTGWREDIPEILSILDVLVLPSLNEAAGMILIEAQAAGVPVVATNVGGITEIVKINETGIIVEPKDPDSLAQAMSILLQDEPRRYKMSEAAKLWVKEKFKTEEMILKLCALYNDLLYFKKSDVD